MAKNGESKKMLVDLSPFFLLEAGGDSEGDIDYHDHDHDYGHNIMMMMGFGWNDNEEDSESCSYDVCDATATSSTNATSHSHSHSPNIHEENDVLMIKKMKQQEGRHGATLTHHHDAYHHYHDDDDDDDDDCKLRVKNSKKGKQSKIECSSTSEVMSTANSNSTRRRSLCIIDSNDGKNMSEKEKSRLFWESCLAS